MTDEDKKVIYLDFGQQVALLASYIQGNHPSFIQEDELIVETAIRIMEKLRIDSDYIIETERQIKRLKEHIGELKMGLSER